MLSIIFSYLSELFCSIFLHGYVANNYAFPPPLKSEDEKKYLKMCRAGDAKAREILIEHNLRLVAHIAKKYSSGGVDNDDLISIGTIGLIKAIDSFDESKNIRLATYASRCIANEILMVMRAGKNRRRETSLQDPIGTDSDGNTISLMNVICNDSESVDEEISLKMQIAKMYEAIKGLGEREKKILIMRYGLDGEKPYTQREIASMMNISRSYVSRIETKALGKLKSELEE